MNVRNESIRPQIITIDGFQPDVRFGKDPLLIQTDQWLESLGHMGRKANTLQTHRSNVRQCLNHLLDGGRETDAKGIHEDDVIYLWYTMDVKENVRWSYIRSLAQMVEYHTGRDIVKKANILHNRDEMDRVFIDKEDFRLAYSVADPYARVILCLGAYMGLRRAEMTNIRDGDISDGMLTVHGKGHGTNGYIVRIRIPEPVMTAIDEYRGSDLKKGVRRDDHLLQTRDRRGQLHRVDPNRVSKTVSVLGERVGVRMTTHSLRRFFATTLYYEVGCDLQTMRNLMRHSNVSTTLKCYVDADYRKEMEASTKLSSLIVDLVSGEDGLS